MHLLPSPVFRLDPDSPLQNKKITIVQGDQKLLNATYKDRFRNYMASQLRARNIDLVLGEYVDHFPADGSGELGFRSGVKMDAGLVVSGS